MRKSSVGRSLLRRRRWTECVTDRVTEAGEAVFGVRTFSVVTEQRRRKKTTETHGSGRIPNPISLVPAILSTVWATWSRDVLSILQRLIGEAAAC